MNEISRRTALKTAAWSAPIVALAVAAPAASASNPTADYLMSSLYGGWNTEGVFGLEVYVTYQGAPSAGQIVTFVLNPSGTIYTATTYGSNGFANVNNVQAPVDTASVTFEVGDATQTKTVTGTPPVQPAG